MLDKDLPGHRDWLDWAGAELMPETARLNEEAKTQADIERAISIALQQEATTRRTREIEDRIDGLAKGRQAAIDLHLDGGLDADALDQQIGRIEDEEMALKAELAEYASTPATLSMPMTMDDGSLLLEDKDVPMSSEEQEVAATMWELGKTPSVLPLAPSKRKEREEEPGRQVYDPKVGRYGPTHSPMKLTLSLVRPLQELEVGLDLRDCRRRSKVPLLP
jgi:hypothetical protein